MRRIENSFCKRAYAIWRAESGMVTVEMALVMVILSGLVFGVVEVGRFVLLRYHLEESTYHAARYLALNPSDVDTARAMVRAEVERNVWGGIGEVELYVKSARRDGQCLLIVESKAHYANSSLSWLLNDPSAESAQVWPQASECGESAARPLPSATPTSTPSPTPIRVSAPQIEQAEGIALVNANLRLGPGFEFAIVGRLSQGESVQVRGRDESATWLEVVPERIGWVYAPLIQIDYPVFSLRVASSPPVPQHTPAPPPRMQFVAEPSAMQLGECAMLRWNAEGAKFVTLNEENVTAHGERRVCPTQDAKYVLSAGYSQERFFDREVNVVVETSNGTDSK